MFATLSRGWSLTKLSLSVVRQDKELLLLPIISTLALIFTATIFFGAGGYLAVHGALSDPWMYGLLLGLYFTGAFIQIYFNTGIVAAARIRLDGGDPTLHDAFAASNRNLGRIFAWSLVAATVGILLNLLQRQARQHGGILGSMIGNLAGMAWNLATYFVLPIIIAEELGPIEAIKRSAGTFKRTWGETVTSGFGIGIVFLLLGLLGFGVFIVLLMLLGGAGIYVVGALVGAFVLYLLVLFVVGATASQVLVAALYRFATQGETGGVLGNQAAAHLFDDSGSWQRYTDPNTGRIRGA